MSFGYPLARDKRSNPPLIERTTGPYCVPDDLTQGLKKPIKDTLDVSHPLEHLQKNKSDRDLQLNLNMLRNIQGIHAPLRLMMELKSFDNVGRLPFLPSSNLSRDVLLGRDDCIDFEDILNPPSVHENLVRPHVVVERKLGLL